MKNEQHGEGRRPGAGKAERYVQPSILMALSEKETYGYELIKDIQQFGFIEGQAPPGMIYRHLRQLEEDGLVQSKWDTQDAGPAKRIYQATAEGLDVLGAWVDYMEHHARALNNFIAKYRSGKAG